MTIWVCNTCGLSDSRPMGAVCERCRGLIKISGPHAKLLADQLVARFWPDCVMIAVAGSIRRGKKLVGDIEIVAMPILSRADLQQQTLFPDDGFRDSYATRLDAKIKELIDDKLLRPNPTQPIDGQRYKRFLYTAHDLPLDLFIVRPPATWGVIYAIRTGPAEFSRALVSSFLPHGWHIASGQLFDAAGDVVPTPDEATFFSAIDLPWLDASNRGAADYKFLMGLQGRRRALPK